MTEGCYSMLRRPDGGSWTITMKCRACSAAANWARLARFIAADERIAHLGRRAAHDGVPLRVRAIRAEAGLGVLVRERDGLSPRHYGIRAARRSPATIFFSCRRSLFRLPCW